MNTDSKLKEEEIEEIIVGYIKGSSTDNKIMLGQYILITLSRMAIDVNSNNTKLSIEFSHNGKRYKAKMVITQKKIIQ